MSKRSCLLAGMAITLLDSAATRPSASNWGEHRYVAGPCPSAPAGRNRPGVGLRRVTAAAVVALLALVGGLVCVASPASADAKSGVCAGGAKLGKYTYTEPAYDSAGEEMWSITWTKRWCYQTSTKRVVSAYSPAPSVKIYSYFDLAWRSKGVTAHDGYFTNVDARGVKHPNYPHWGHYVYWTILMQHCALKWTLCTNHYYTVGTTGYWDGSKKIVDKAS